jgi:hypothetical protein
MPIPRVLLEALASEHARRSKTSEFRPEALCFGPQRRFVESTARRLVADCSRRAGKTVGEAIRKLLHAMREPYAPQLYVTLTRLNAKQILWPELLRLNEEYGLGGSPNHAELILRMPHGADIVLTGANTEREIEKIRGKRFKSATIDEPQSIPDRILKPLVHDIISPALLDFDGSLALIGTPGAARVGLFYRACHGEGQWERHQWTMRDNPWLERLSGKPVSQLLAEVRAEHGWTEDDPTYRREFCGEWVDDQNALVFRWSDACIWDGGLGPGDWRYVMGVDLGFEDSDAIAVLAWQPHSPSVYLVYEHVGSRAGVTELGERVREVWQRYKPMATWVDSGGLGRKIVEELRVRWQIPCEAAEKVRKAEHIELLNDALRSGRFFASPSSRFAEDARLVTWDMDSKAKCVLKVSDRYHSDVCDAVLYAYRACLAFLARPQLPVADPQEAERARRHAARAAEVGRTWLDKVKRRDASRLMR